MRVDARRWTGAALGCAFLLPMAGCVIETGSGSPGDGYRPYNGNVPASTRSATSVAWGTNAATWRGMNGLRVLYECPPGGSAAAVWGTDVYTDDSSVCTAGVHAGRITFGGGGPVVIEIRAGESSYAGTLRNGVTTRQYGSYVGSFFVL